MLKIILISFNKCSFGVWNGRERASCDSWWWQFYQLFFSILGSSCNYFEMSLISFAYKHRLTRYATSCIASKPNLEELYWTQNHIHTILISNNNIISRGYGERRDTRHNETTKKTRFSRISSLRSLKSHRLITLVGGEREVFKFLFQ